MDVINSRQVFEYARRGQELGMQALLPDPCAQTLPTRALIHAYTHKGIHSHTKHHPVTHSLLHYYSHTQTQHHAHTLILTYPLIESYIHQSLAHTTPIARPIPNIGSLPPSP